MKIYKVTIKLWIPKVEYFKTKKGVENWLKTWKMILGKKEWNEDSSYEVKEIEVYDNFEFSKDKEYCYGVEVFFNIRGPKTGIHNNSPFYNDDQKKEEIIRITLPNPIEGKQGKLLTYVRACSPEDAVSKALEQTREILKDHRAINEAYMYLSMISDDGSLEVKGKYEDIIENKNYTINSRLEIQK